jgi:hypothetical protein
MFQALDPDRLIQYDYRDSIKGIRSPDNFSLCLMVIDRTTLQAYRAGLPDSFIGPGMYFYVITVVYLMVLY